MNDGRNLLTNSRMQTAKTCLRRHFLAYELGIRKTQTSQPLRFGSNFHQGLDMLAQGASIDAVCSIVSANYADVPAWVQSDEERLEWDVECEVCIRLLIGYQWRWSQADVEIVATEQVFDLPIINPRTGHAAKIFRLAGKIDKIIRVGGRLAVMEHKCVSGDVEIIDYASGKIRTAKELFESQDAPVVLSLDATGSLRRTPALPLREAGQRPIFKVTTASGRSIRVSGNHPFLTPTGWRQADVMFPGCYVAIPMFIPQSKTDSRFSDDEVAFVGYMLGDGSINASDNSPSLQFSKSPGPALDAFVTCIEKMGYSKDRKDHLNYGICSTAGRKAWGVRISAKPHSPAIKLFNSLGIEKHLAADKFIPSELKMIPDRQAGILLGALWSTDGCIDTFDEKRTLASGGTAISQKTRICYSSRSGRLCNDIRFLLKRLGIESSTTESSVAYKGKRLPYFTVKIVGRDSKRQFVSLVQCGVIPVSRLSCDLESFSSSIKPGTFCRTAIHHNLPDNAEVVWDKVKAVSLDGEEMTYDLTVPETHNFVANEFITHNTAGHDIGPEADYWRRLRIDQQISLYVIAARSLGYEIETVIYDVVRKPSIRPKKLSKGDCESFFHTQKYFDEAFAVVPTGGDVVRVNGFAVKMEPLAKSFTIRETPSMFGARLAADIFENFTTYFARQEIARLDRDLHEFYAELWHFQEMLRNCQRNGHWFKNTSACLAPYRCEFADICLSGRDVSQEIPQGFTRLDYVHPELKEEVRV